MINHEHQRRKRRLNAAAANTVWEYRTSPPKEWTDPLPEDLRLRQTETAKLFKTYEEKGGVDPLPSRCLIQ